MAGDLYFPGQAPQLTAQLDGFLNSLAEDLHLKPDLASGISILLLAGGYGRGEGGIFRKNDNAPAELYNDLEFYLIAHPSAPEAPLRAWCSEHAHRGDAALGIEVEFKILRTTQLLSGRPTMFYYDLLSAHRLVFGSEQFLQTLPDSLRNAAVIPAEEATRLLFNRGSGLFYSRVALAENSELATNGFIERNHAKVRLALADAVLALNGRYHFSCVERGQRLGEALSQLPPDWTLLCDWHKQGVAFKLHPRHLHPSRAQLEQSQNELTAVWLRTFLWLESIRLHRAFHTATDYAEHTGKLYPESPLWKNLALAARDQLKRGSKLPILFDYPRAALQRALVLLLEPDADLTKAGRLLGIKSEPSLSGIRDLYRHWWGHYN